VDGVEAFEGFGEFQEIGNGKVAADIDVLGHDRTAVDDPGEPADDDEVDAVPGQPFQKVKK